MSSNNWYENYPYLRKIYEYSQELHPFPVKWKDLEPWFNKIDSDIPDGDLKALLGRIPINGYVAKKKAKEFLVKEEILEEGDFDKIWKILKEKKKKTEEKLYSNYKIRDMILSKYHIKTIEESGEVLIYDNTVYRRRQTRRLSKFVTDMMEELGITFSKNKKNNIIDLIKSETLISIEKFRVKPEIINVTNGLLNILTGEITKHTPKYLSVRKIPVKYDKNAKCPKIDQFLKSIFHPNDIDFILQYIGLSLTPIMYYQLALLLYGDGNNGKTTFGNLWTALIGKKNRSSVDLKNLDGSFDKADLEEKLINMVMDIGSGEIKITTFKLLVGDEATFNVNRKFLSQYQAKPTAKFIYGCNKTFPNVPKDTDKGFWRKWALVECPNNFDNNKIVNYIEQLTTEEELSGLLNRAIRGFQQLHGNEGFEKRYNDWESVKEIWLSKQNIFLPFLNKYCKIGKYEDGNTDKDNEFWEYKDTVFQIFNYWRENIAKQSGIPKGKLTRQINRTPGLFTTTRLINKKRPKIYAGFKFNTEFMKLYNHLLKEYAFIGNN